MNGMLAAGGAWLLSLLPALLAVFAGCVLFVLLLALLGCHVMSKRDKP